jgi:HK97 family phage major capsid protein
MKASLTNKSVEQIVSRLTESQKNTAPSFGQLVRALAKRFGRAMNPNGAADEAAFKALTTGTSPGSYLVPEIQANEILPQLLRSSQLLKSGAQLLPCGSIRKLDVPVETGTFSLQFISENLPASPVDPTFEQRNLVTKDLRAMFFASVNLARTSVPAFDQIVARQAAKAIARGIDSAFFAGMAGGPNSIANIPNVKVVNQAGSSLAYSDLVEAFGSAIDSEAPIEDFAWFVNGPVFRKIYNLKDANGRPILRPCRGDNGSAFELMGLPLYITPALPNHIGSGSATSFIFLTFPENIIVADGQMELAISEGYRFEYNQLAVRVVKPIDFAIGQPAAAILLENVI